MARMVPEWTPEAWEIEEYERIRQVRESEEREYIRIPVGPYEVNDEPVPSPASKSTAVTIM